MLPLPVEVGSNSMLIGILYKKYNDPGGDWILGVRQASQPRHTVNPKKALTIVSCKNSFCPSPMDFESQYPPEAKPDPQ